MTALTALTERMVRISLRDFDLALGVFAPAVTLVGVNLALRHVIDTGELSYADYVLPGIIVQAMLLGAVTTADRAAAEQASGFAIRLRIQPMSALTPMTARLIYCLMRGTLALVATIGTALLIGVHLPAQFADVIAFLLIPLVLAVALSLAGDAVGTAIARLGAGQLLLVPQLILILVSTALAPAESFPEWVQPFVRHQPVSQIVDTLRDLAHDTVGAADLAAAVGWCIGLLLAFGAIATHLQGRRR
ncbi:MAG: ABC transporter permease [Actinomycetota bacterium]|nr:ABC transporter permease [Actinomycetota bacterium]